MSSLCCAVIKLLVGRGQLWRSQLEYDRNPLRAGPDSDDTPAAAEHRDVQESGKSSFFVSQVSPRKQRT